ncbi:hypothetical protein SKTS_33280 [Sulfurimicrobium lacus]|uniref:Bacteriophage protein n=1 Tax=Sulfurimicrobium lacus TaxID=2715678 RepID=A0A6F8VHM1_9PROT|nr:hypothetical protein [Sulfurimicrobium lacus]BCB28442.1 hypothetical protein SKTS_33280 [Sulfurimicrobium lacus]
MKITAHTPREFVDAIKDLLPPGAAWDWPVGGMGDGMLLGTAAELARVEAAAQNVLDSAIETHRPKTGSWHISEYRRVAVEALGGLTETMPRRPAAIGGHIGDRLWSHAAPGLNFPIDLVRVEHLLGPARVGSRIGDRLWGSRGRYVLRVRYYRSVVNPAVLWEALAAFKQAHVFLWFEDISGVGGNYGQN